MKEKLAHWKEFVRQRLQYWTLAEEICRRTGLMNDAATCAMHRIDFAELLSCVEEMERLAA